MFWQTAFRAAFRQRPGASFSRPWTIARLGLGVSVLAVLTNQHRLHNEAEADSSSSDKSDPPLGAGFTQDRFGWQQAIKYLGNEAPDGIIRMYWSSRFDTRIRIMSRGPRTLISMLEGDFVNRANVADVIQENLWFNLEALFRWYQTDLSTPQPVEFIHEPHPSPEAIHSVIRTAINFTDDFIRDFFLGRVFSSISKRYASDALRATTSSCLVSALYEEDVSLLHVANLGNMRAVLGRPRPPTEDGSVIYDVHVLSVDHTPQNPLERARIQAQHADEEIFTDDTLFGRPYTRALGDGPLKWSTDIHERLHRDYLAPEPDPRIKTPPYLSAEPDTTSIKVESGDFLVLSSSWLPQCLTDEEVVGLVGAWLQKNQDTNLYRSLDDTVPDPTPGVVLEREDLPVKLKEDNTTFFRKWNVPKRFVNSDPNPSMHLTNNAMGGADGNLRQALLELAPSESAGNTKSLGIAVVFFQ
ncbi:PPM-type phosphatase domain-containing protein [Mycena indigotica]|uniref:PPM-type phosphatase domain-containing protein n=1 Tax=Mycena indigotica TaxID=2126181 RepID=A0A8H6TDY6_9AGAR|nr:PPM-type phosphatase domain-containing protein [Mycena indigotica]KAF7314981.1 PPM-type phosphatase domain-containing protein [Mycena indigotica]